MPKILPNPLTLLCVGLLLGTPLQAQDNSDQMFLNVARDLPKYNTDVDPATLSRSKLAALYMILQSSKSDGDKRLLIDSALGGPNTLRGLLKKL